MSKCAQLFVVQRKERKLDFEWDQETEESNFIFSWGHANEGKIKVARETWGGKSAQMVMMAILFGSIITGSQGLTGPFVPTPKAPALDSGQPTSNCLPTEMAPPCPLLFCHEHPHIHIVLHITKECNWLRWSYMCSLTCLNKTFVYFFTCIICFFALLCISLHGIF